MRWHKRILQLKLKVPGLLSITGKLIIFQSSEGDVGGCQFRNFWHLLLWSAASKHSCNSEEWFDWCLIPGMAYWLKCVQLTAHHLSKKLRKWRVMTNLSKRSLSGYKRTIDGWESITSLNLVVKSNISTPRFINKQKYPPLSKNIYPWAKISAPEQKYLPLSKNICPWAKISIPEQLAGQAQLHSASLDTEAWSAALADAAQQSSRGEQCTTKHASVEVEWMIL